MGTYLLNCFTITYNAIQAFFIDKKSCPRSSLRNLYIIGRYSIIPAQLILPPASPVGWVI